jgi:hypothetical protein
MTHRLGILVHADELDTKKPGNQANKENLAIQQSRTWMDEWLLSNIIGACMIDFQVDSEKIKFGQDTINLWITFQGWYKDADLTAYQLVNMWIADPEMQKYLLINRYGGELWFNQERFDQCLWWAHTIALIQLYSDSTINRAALRKKVSQIWKLISKISGAVPVSGYKVDKLIEAVR